MNNFTKITNGMAILRSLNSEFSQKYGINSGKQTLPMSMAALAFNRLKPSAEWSKADLDEILNKGDQLYLTTMDEIQEKETHEQLAAAEKNTELADNDGNNGGGDGLPSSSSFSVKTDNVKKELTIGLNKFDVEFEDLGQGKIFKYSMCCCSIILHL